jgi:hypothetical protein
MLEEKEWNAILVAKILDPDLYERIYDSRIGSSLPAHVRIKNGEEKTITIRARIRLRAVNEAIKVADYYSKVHLGSVKYEVKSVSLKKSKGAS